MNYETMMQTNLKRVFSERDSARRIETIRKLYLESADPHEPTGSVHGHDAINQAVTELLSRVPYEFTFTAIRPALALGHIARLQWRSGPPEGPVAQEIWRDDVNRSVMARQEMVTGTLIYPFTKARFS